MNNLKDTLKELEEKRIALDKRGMMLLPFLIMIPLCVLFYLSTRDMPHTLPIVAGSGILSFMLYTIFVNHPFQTIKASFKSALVREFMQEFHPDIKFKYRMGKKHGRNIVDATQLISFDSSFEEDVLEGIMNGASFYVSEMTLSEDNGDDEYTVFKGIVFQLNMPGKNFPVTEIQTNISFWSNLIGRLSKDKGIGFYYATEDEKSFREKLGPLLPFIGHLQNQNKSIRVKASGDRMTIMLENNMAFMDTPSLSPGRSLYNKDYNASLAKQLNSLLFIVESFVNNLEESEIVSKLELKSLEILRKNGLQ